MKVVAATISLGVLIGAACGAVQGLGNVSVIVDQKPQGFCFIRVGRVIVLELLGKTINRFQDVTIGCRQLWNCAIRAERDVEEMALAIRIVLDVVSPTCGRHKIARAPEDINIAIMEDMDSKWWNLNLKSIAELLFLLSS
jgi:hypothetical protein